ncbi:MULTISPECIES: cytochrome P450 [Streptomyces]|uniref:Cytochrome P450 167A1 n=1 Tax=Streptomyces chartreusis NRRL 3882 TaxID=1079985 RepID=A0A2N9BKH0_STRCX|nr:MULTISPECIES: cytochrome P450 [Streptomyces]SOR83858.1 Cytochrome P450 167A1 [Streptomyces chartreusis NRRL 3882]
MISTTTPVSDVDIFDDEVLNDPYPVYEELRDLGAAVYLPRHGCWVLPRYAQVRAALGDHGRFSSVDSVGLEPALNERRRGGVLASDPPEHEVLRGVLSESLAPRALAKLRTDIGRRAGELVAPLVERETFDVVRDLARVFPVSVVADLIGMPLAAREEVLRFADAGRAASAAARNRTAFTDVPSVRGELLTSLKAPCAVTLLSGTRSAPASPAARLPSGRARRSLRRSGR